MTIYMGNNDYLMTDYLMTDLYYHIASLGQNELSVIVQKHQRFYSVLLENDH